MSSTGRCLCGAVRYEVDGPLRDVVLCHCVECLRWHGGPCPATAAERDQLRLVEERGLRWIESPESDAHARRGFCGECGSSLFWAAPDRTTISISAGTLDPPTGLRTVRQIYTAQAPDWDEVDPSLPSG
ncbi:MAG TPA: GFA family protein [Myxococcota bacterium]|nr:GFA family protein [Myxococcota bacterium]